MIIPWDELEKEAASRDDYGLGTLLLALYRIKWVSVCFLDLAKRIKAKEAD